MRIAKFFYLLSSVLSLSVFIFSMQNVFAVDINGDGRGGGDVVNCKSDPQVSRYQGLYTLDYLLTRQDDFNENKDEQFRIISRNVMAQDLALSIAKKLDEVSPAAAKSLRSFLAFVENENWKNTNEDSTEIFRVWVSAPRLAEYQDEDFITDVPQNCYRQNGKRDISQIILREDVNSTIIYHYNRLLFNELKATPLQMSYLLIHEWLRDYTVHSSIIQNVNRYLHSATFFSSQGYESAAIFKRMGLLFDRDPSREPVVQLMNFDTGVNRDGSAGHLDVHIKVKNIQYHKNVVIYYSLDGGEWTELPASYKGPLSFGFEEWIINTDFARSGSAIDFAIKYQVGGQIYWDNNEYKNYHGVFRYKTSFAR